MAVKVFEHGTTYAVVGGDGRGLRVVDRPKRCKGYRNMCSCKKCLGREARKVKRPKAAQCECEHPLSILAGECFRCGKPTAFAVAA